MPNSTASYAAAEFAQHDFSHSLQKFCITGTPLIEFGFLDADF